MNYRPETVKSKSMFGGPRGGGKIVWNKAKTKVLVTLGEDTFTFDKDDLPHQSFPSGEYYVAISEDKSKLLTMRPNNGMFVGKVNRFAAKEGENPAPRTYTSPAHPDWEPYQLFDVVIDILSPKEYAGLDVLFSGRYHFEGVEIDVKGQKTTVVAYNHPKSKYTPLLQDFCDATGIWDKGPMKFATNILPTMAKRVAQADRKFQFVMKDGWIITIFSMPVVEEDDDEELELESEAEEVDNTKTPDVLEEDDGDELPWNDGE